MRLSSLFLGAVLVLALALFSPAAPSATAADKCQCGTCHCGDTTTCPSPSCTLAAVVVDPYRVAVAGYPDLFWVWDHHDRVWRLERVTASAGVVVGASAGVSVGIGFDFGLHVGGCAGGNCGASANHRRR